MAHHSNARCEARLRGFRDYESEFGWGDSLLDHALTFCDMSTSPHGTPVRIEERVEEIVERYGANHPTAQAVAAGLPEFLVWRAQVAPLLHGQPRT